MPNPRNPRNTRNLSPVVEKFILHWGEMGTKWGINRTVAQVHALLYLADRPRNAEEITETLGVARSNVSTSLKELQNWGIVRVVHVLGDRRDHFESLTDVWEMFQIVLDERKRREIDPTLKLLRECLGDMDRDKSSKTEPHDRALVRELIRGRLEAMLSFFETMSTWYGQIRRMPQGAVIKFVKLGGKVGRMLGAVS
jgi:DNA-binding transcriptional regulator GbsR (MarR family)